MSVVKDKTKPEWPEADYYEAMDDGIDVFSWSPTPAEHVRAGKPQAPSTQVHVHFITSLGRLLIRFKGKGRTLDAHIAALIKHRRDVWGEPEDPNTTWGLK